MLLLWFLCPPDVVGGRRRHTLFVVALAGTSLLAVTAWFRAADHLYLPQYIAPDADPDRQAAFVLSHPVRYLGVLRDTVRREWARWLTHAFGWGTIVPPLLGRSTRSRWARSRSSRAAADPPSARARKRSWSGPASPPRSSSSPCAISAGTRSAPRSSGTSPGATSSAPAGGGRAPRARPARPGSAPDRRLDVLAGGAAVAFALAAIPFLCRRP